MLTELALEKYQWFEKKLAAKTALKKQAKKILKETEQQQIKSEDEEYFDEELQIICIRIKTNNSNNFVWTPSVHPEPESRCIICGAGLYLMDYNDICLWCDKQQKEKS